MFRVLVYGFLLVTLPLGALLPLAFAFALYRIFFGPANDSEMRDADGYRIVGYSHGYNPMHYVDRRDRKPMKRRKVLYEFI